MTGSRYNGVIFSVKMSFLVLSALKDLASQTVPSYFGSRIL